MERKILFPVLLTGFLANAAWGEEIVPVSAPGGGIQIQEQNLAPPAVSYGAPFTGAGQRGGWNAGGSLYFLKPFASENIASVSSFGLGTSSPTTNRDEFNWNFQPAFKVWLGCSSCSGLGFRLGFFQFDNSSSQLDQTLNSSAAASSKIEPSPYLPTLPGGFGFVSPGLLLNTAGAAGVDKLTFGSNLLVRTLDLEATYAWGNANQCQVLFSGGARYARLNQGYSAFLNNTGTTFGGAGVATEQQSLDYTRQFEGWGLTAALEGQLPLQCCRGLSLYGTARGSFIFGNTTSSLNYLQVINDPSGAAGGNQRNTASVNSTTHPTLPILELELGAQYRCNLGSRCDMFLRAGAVSQTYFGAGTASNTEGNLGLFGGQVSLGFNF